MSQPQEQRATTPVSRKHQQFSTSSTLAKVRPSSPMNVDGDSWLQDLSSASSHSLVKDLSFVANTQEPKSKAQSRSQTPSQYQPHSHHGGQGSRQNTPARSPAPLVRTPQSAASAPQGQQPIFAAPPQPVSPPAQPLRRAPSPLHSTRAPKISRKQRFPVRSVRVPDSATSRLLQLIFCLPFSLNGESSSMGSSRGTSSHGDGESGITMGQGFRQLRQVQHQLYQQKCRRRHERLMGWTPVTPLVPSAPRGNVMARVGARSSAAATQQQQPLASPSQPSSKLQASVKSPRNSAQQQQQQQQQQKQYRQQPSHQQSGDYDPAQAPMLPAEAAPVVKRKRGRPRKKPLPEVVLAP